MTTKTKSTEILFEHSATPTEEDKKRYPTLVSDDEDEKKGAAAASADNKAEEPEAENPTDSLSFKIDGFSKQKKGTRLCSDSKTTKDVTWRLLVFPKGNNTPDFLSIFLEVANHKDLKPGWSYNGSFTLEVANTKDPDDTLNHASSHLFNEREPDWGFNQFAKLSDLTDKSRGWIHDDSITLLATFQRLPDVVPWGVLGGYDSRKETGYVGLRNQGATCYMNSLLQTLYHTSAFTQAVFQLPTESDEPTKSIPLALQRVFFGLRYSQSPIGTRELTKSFGWDSYDSFTQHDVQELNRVLVDKIEEKMKGTPAEGTISKLLSGKLKHAIRCTDIKFESLRDETFYDLSMNVKGCKTLEESFVKYTEAEMFEGDNKYFAEGHGLQRAKKTTAFGSFPPVLHIQLKRWEYDPMRDCMAKVNDRFEFPLDLELDRFLDDSVRAAGGPPNAYQLHAVLIHSGDVNGGHYYAYIRPTDAPKWFRMDDERVSKASVREVMEDSFGGDKEFTFHVNGKKTTSLAKRFTNAYMLVYIRVHDKASSLFKIHSRNIPFHLHVRFADEQNLSLQREKETTEAYTCMNVKFATEEHLRAHVNKPDLVSWETVVPLKVKKTTPMRELRAMIAEKLGVAPAQRVRLLQVINRQNRTVRPDAPLVIDEKPLETLTTKGELKLLVEVSDKEPVAGSPPEDQQYFAPWTTEDIKLYLKHYDALKGSLTFMGTLMVHTTDKMAAVVDQIKVMARLSSAESKVVVYEEVKPNRLEAVQPQMTMIEGEMTSGDILILQELPAEQPLNQPTPAHPTPADLFEYQANRVDVRFRLLSKPDTDVVKVELSKLDTHDKIVAKLAAALPSPPPPVDPQFIRLTAHNQMTNSPRGEAVKHGSETPLSDLLTWPSTVMCDVMYYEILTMPLVEFESKRAIKLTWFGLDGKQGETHDLLINRNCFVRDVLALIAEKHPSNTAAGGSGKYRLLEVYGHKLYREFSPDSPLSSLTEYTYPSTGYYGTQYSYQYRVEEKSLDEQNMTSNHVRLHVVHFTKDINGSANLFGDPFYAVVKKGTTLAEFKPVLQKRFGVSDEEFAKWKFAHISYMQPKMLEDKNSVTTDAMIKNTAGEAWGGAYYANSAEYFGLYHTDVSAKSPASSPHAAGYRHVEKSIKING